MSRTRPLVSVVLPCFNAANTVGEAVASILEQEFGDFEIIIVDDGSNDGSLAEAERIAARDARVRVIGDRHHGIVNALRTGCSAAQGVYIARMDADDVAHPARLACQVELMEAYPDVVLCGTQVEPYDGAMGEGLRRYFDWVNALYEPENIARERYVECPVPHPTFLFRRSSYEAIGGYRDAGWPEDYDLLMRWAATDGNIGKVPAPLLRWRHSAGRLSMSDERYSGAAFRRLKQHFLLHGELGHWPVFHQWGAGEVGKRWLLDWSCHNRPPEKVVDINPRKLGKRIHGVEVIPPEELPPPGEGFTLIAVGAPGARTEIRAWFEARGYTETRDYFFVA